MDRTDRYLAAPWDTYTPTWTAATTNPALGNGTLVGRFRLIGRTVVCRIHLVAGSTTTFGSGAFRFALPLAAATTGTNLPQVGEAVLLDEGVTWYDAKAYIGSGDSFVQLQTANVSGTRVRLSFVDSTTPFTWGSTDKINIGPFVYEKA